MGKLAFHHARTVTPILLLFGAHINLPAQRAALPQESVRAFRVESAADLVANWTEGQHLYVKGELGVSEHQLSLLELWLDANGTNWVVLLLENADEEVYVDSTGREHRGLDAVEYALGQGLPNQTPFNQWIDPRTSESNGAIFILFLKERKFSYFGSTAQDRRGLGEASWADRLDAPAKQAMREGGRIVDAVKQTVSSINDRLQQRITAEIAAEEKRVAEEQAARELAMKESNELVRSAAEALGQFQLRIAEFRQQNPALIGDLAHPDVRQFETVLNSARAALEKEVSREATRLAGQLLQRLAILTEALNEYETAGLQLDRMSVRLMNLRESRFASAAQESLSQAQEALEQARLHHERGDSGYRAYLQGAMAAAGVAQRRIHQAEELAEFKRHASMAGAVLFLILLCAAATSLALRRRKIKKEAEQLLEDWKHGLGEKNAAVFAVLDRLARVAGRSSAEIAERFSGKSQELCQELVKNVDQLVIMSSCIARVLGDAERLIDPVRLWAILINIFSRGRYQKAIALLRNTPIEFRPDEALELILRGPQTTRQLLLGDLASYAPFRMSFEELLTQFNARAQRALDILERIEMSASSIQSELAQLQNRIDELQRAERKEAGAMLWFELEPVYSQLLPALQSRQLDGLNLAVRDPVTAMESVSGRGREQAADAEGLVQLSNWFQNTVWNQLDSMANELRKFGAAVDWIWAELKNHSARADELARTALEESVAERIGQMHAAITALLERATQAAALATRLRDSSEQELEEICGRLQLLREELARALKLQTSEILCEPEGDPDVLIERARIQLAGAKAAIDSGSIERGTQALDECEKVLAEAGLLMDAAENSFKEFKTRHQRIQQGLVELEESLAGYNILLRELRTQYSEPVFLLGSGDPAHPNANGRVDDNLSEVADHLAAVRKLSSEAVQAFESGRLLAAAACLEEMEAHQESALFRCAEIDEKQIRLKRAEDSNQQLYSRLCEEVQKCEQLAEDPSITQTTLGQFEHVKTRLSRSRPSREAQRNPFATQLALNELSALLEELNAQASADRVLRAEAESSVRMAAAQVEAASEMALRAASDEVADSPEVLRARRDLDFLAGALLRVQKESRMPHADWKAIDIEADRIASEAARHAATLRGQIQLAEEAVHAIESAAAQVRRATEWTGRHGVGISASVGADWLLRAKQALAEARYADAQREAAQAESSASRAISEAEALVRRRERQQQQLIELERRRRRSEESRRVRSLSSSSRSIGRSGFSSRSGMGRSSFSSRSGFGRSGW